MVEQVALVQNDRAVEVPFSPATVALHRDSKAATPTVHRVAMAMGEITNGRERNTRDRMERTVLANRQVQQQLLMLHENINSTFHHLPQRQRWQILSVLSTTKPIHQKQCKRSILKPIRCMPNLNPHCHQVHHHLRAPLALLTDTHPHTIDIGHIYIHRDRVTI